MEDQRLDNVRKFGFVLLVALLAALASFAPVAQADPERPMAGEAEPIVRCDPAVAAGSSEDNLVVDIYVENVVDLYGADVRLSFDTSIAQVVDAEPGSPTSVQIEPLDDFLQPDFVVRKVADNTAGTIWYASTQINPTPEVSGSGPLARITFKPLKAGSFTMPITEYELARRDGTTITAVTVDCKIAFVGGDPGLMTFLPVIMADYSEGR